MFSAYLVNVLKGVDDIIRQAGQQVNYKPGLDVVHSDELGIGDDLTSWTDEGSVEVENNVDKEDDVHNTVHHQPSDIVLLGLEGHVVGNHDGSVEGEDEDNPVPSGLEQAVVQNDVGWSLWRFLFVLR